MTDNDSQHDWSEWKPDFKPHAKNTNTKTPHGQQEKHSPSENITLRQNGTREKQDARRRITDARLWDAMTPMQQDAAIEVAHAFETMSRGLGYVTSNWERIPGGRGADNAGEMHARLIRGYVEWTALCVKNNVSHSLVVDILVFGFSCRALDRDRRQGTGFARRNLMDGLLLYADMKGWPRG